MPYAEAFVRGLDPETLAPMGDFQPIGEADLTTVTVFEREEAAS